MGRASATGDGVAIATQEALRLRGIDPQGATVAIQGFGKVGYWAAIALQKMGLTVVAVSDVQGGVTGFKSVNDVFEYSKLAGTVVGTPNTDVMTNEE